MCVGIYLEGLSITVGDDIPRMCVYAEKRKKKKTELEEGQDADTDLQHKSSHNEITGLKQKLN